MPWTTQSIANDDGDEDHFDFTVEGIDITMTVYAADSLLGPWTALAQSVNGAAFTPLAGATLAETGMGNARDMVVTDIFPGDDPNHPRRFMKLVVTPTPP